ncbi:MAG: leucine-rich repeat protein, partial [Clostridia bacterium]|nr:leucine-rich repeat protein [Clostridia bacterium]
MHFSFAKATWRCLRDGKAAEQFRPIFYYMKKINLKNIFASMLMIMLCPIVINAEEGYYYVGSQTGWDLSNKTYKFSKMDDGKTWTLTMIIDTSDDFQIAPLSVESWNDSRYKVAEGSSGLSGMMNFSPFDGTNFSVSTETPGSYTIKIVPSELTYEISLEGSSITYKDGDSFTAKTKEGVDMGFQVISTTNMTCGVSGNAIAKDTEGHVTIPDTVNGFSVVSIGTEKGFGSFNSCKNLKSITIPNSITSIMFGSFYGCSSLTKVILNSNAITSITFGNYPYNNIESFFGSQVSEYVIGDDVISIGEHAFYNCDSLKTVTIGNSVTNIGDAAFYSCHSLKTVTIGNSVTSIGKYAFSNCISMTSVNITDLTAWCGIKFNEKDSNPLYYAMHLFLNDEEVKDLIIPEGLTNISEYAFTNCGDLMSVYIPNSVTSISYRAFYGCSNLAKFT